MSAKDEAAAWAEAVQGVAAKHGLDYATLAAARFDYVLANPKVGRLATWRALERAEPTEAEAS